METWHEAARVQYDKKGCDITYFWRLLFLNFFRANIFEN